MGLFEGIANGIRDNALWTIIQWLWSAKGGILLALLISGCQWLLDLPTWVHVLLTPIAVIVAFAFGARLHTQSGRVQVASVADSEMQPPPPLNLVDAPPQDFPLLEFASHGKGSTELVLEVTNQGVPVRISATLKIINARSVNSYKTYSFEGQWIGPPIQKRWGTNGKPYRLFSDTRIDPHKSKRLLIAKIRSPDGPTGIAEMRLNGIDEGIFWDQETSSTLPFFDLEVVFTTKEFPNESLFQRYRVGPATPTGPLQMILL